MRRLLVLGVSLFLLARGGVAAQQKPRVEVQPAQPVPGSDLRAFLLTMGQGVEVYERFGHNAVWVHDPAIMADSAYNWGEFDFSQPHFIQRFLQGKMLYWMGPQSVDFMAYVYQVRQRTMWAQELNLTPAQKKQLQDFVRWNSLEENKFYRYDYYRDNCSTRARDALDRALGGELQRVLKSRMTDKTYRTETRRLMLANIDPPGVKVPHSTRYKVINVALVTGMDLAMGPAIDQPLSQWDASFIPMELQTYVRAVYVKDAKGQEAPLVLNERVLVDSHRPPPPDAPPEMLNWYLAAGVAIAGVLALAGAFLKRRGGRALFLILAGGWSLLIGILGTLIAGLWAFTDHVVTYGNENVLQANPISLVLLVALIGLGVGQKWGRKVALRTSMVVAGLSFIGFLFQAIPSMNQVNGTIIALLLPAHVVIAWTLQRWPSRSEIPAS